jgi:hypothetical protein
MCSFQCSLKYRGKRDGSGETIGNEKPGSTVIHPEIQLGCHSIENKDIIAGLDSFVENNDIDLIALTHKKRNMFYRIFNPSLAKKLLFKSKKTGFCV